MIVVYHAFMLALCYYMLRFLPNEIVAYKLTALLDNEILSNVGAQNHLKKIPSDDTLCPLQKLIVLFRKYFFRQSCGSWHTHANADH